MGGGDLNLKKSWHPSTMKNIERVWKAEQQDHEEKRKIAELRREIEMERDREDLTNYAMQQGVIEHKDNKKLDWMYKGPNSTVDREEYLLGKAIDKHFEEANQAAKTGDPNRNTKNHVEYECVPPSLRYYSGNEQVDLQRKLNEDPINAIKQKVIESRTQLLTNPVRLKQIKDLLEKQHKQRKLEKKSKKKSKKRNSDDELDALLANKYKKLKNKISAEDLLKNLKKSKKDKPRKRKRDSSSSSSSSESDSEDNEKEKRRRKQNSQSEKAYKDKRDDNREKKYLKRENKKDNYESRSDRKYEDRSKLKEHNEKRNDRERDSSRTQRNYGLIRADGSKLPSPSRKSSPLKYNPSKPIKKEEKRWIPPKREQLTSEEKDRRIKEMMKNAAWRDEERTKNAKRYDEEKKQEQTVKDFNKDFMRSQLAKVYHSRTLETGIRSNINRIDRSKSAMNSNFAKR